MLTNNTNLEIGPLTFTHQVQKINIQERKSVQVVETARSSKNFIIDSGDSDCKAQIRLLFTGLDEINGSASFSQNSQSSTADYSLSGLRALIALFKCCPVTTLNNNYISFSWKKADKIYNKENYNKLKDYLEQVTAINKTVNDLGTSDPIDKEAAAENAKIVTELNSRVANRIPIPRILNRIEPFRPYSFGSVAFPDNFFQKNIINSKTVSIALESLELESVPDIPYAIQATLTIARIDTAPFTRGKELEYVGREGLDNLAPSAKDAFWLKKWIYTLLDTKEIPELDINDFKEAKFSWYGKTANGFDIDTTPKKRFSVQLNTSENTNNNAILISENSSIRHRFAYNKIIGKIFPTAAHMGTTSRFMSMDIVFNNQKDYKTYDSFCEFKYTADEINKARERFDRVTGWVITTPISKLLSSRKNNLTQYNLQTNPFGGVYVPISIITENGDQPDMINCRIDLAENNIQFYSDNEIVLSTGSGTDFDKLNTYFVDIFKKEYRFRQARTGNANILSLALAGTDANAENVISDASVFNLVWPIEKGFTEIKNESGFGIINIDTLRATLLELDKEKNGGSGKLLQALYKSPISSGQLVANKRPTFLDKLYKNFQFLPNIIAGQEIAQEEEAQEIYNEVATKVNRIFTSTAFINDKQKDRLISYLTVGLLGDRQDGLFITNSATGLAIIEIANSDFEFSDAFKTALLNVLVQRKGLPQGLPYIYSTNGIYSGFYKLLLAYSLDRDKVPDTKNDINTIVRKNTNKGSASVYPDLLLPTYRQLFDNKWEDFAPTLEDLGIVVPTDEITPINDRLLAVSQDDYVSPACWFYIHRNKSELKNMMKKSVAAVVESSPSLSLSVPFNTTDIKQIEDLLNERKKLLPESQQYKTKTNAISKAIEDTFTKYATTNPNGFREDVVNILAASEKFKNLIQQNNTIALHFKNNGNYAVPREITVPGLGAEIIRTISNRKFLETNQPALLDPNVEATYVTPLNKQAAFLRGSAKSTEACVQSSIDQVPDDHTSPERMFPAIKVYLLDRRGNDLIADDTLFNVNSIISVDITMDKDDAPVAVIRLADPLYFLQNSYFDEKNVLYSKEKNLNVEDENNVSSSKKENLKVERVFGSLKSADRDSILKRYKIAQGRAVQIRMGYSAMPQNLPIVFTGRIAEIAPGDELTIVCQGWKAELINRKVNFYNDDAKNWGARDLAIQTISYANPDGFGDIFPQHDAQFILRNMDPADTEFMLEKVLENYGNVDLEEVGARDISESVSNWFNLLLIGTSEEKRNKGIDTRLKNIWYPDTQLYTNVLGLRSLFQTMPSWINDSWVIPLQPAWDVLKEASRHAWNCIVDVVPYDGEATIFMGHPDQPYYYTRGDSYSKKGFKAYSTKTKKDFNTAIEELLKRFLESPYYNNSASDNLPVIISELDVEVFVQTVTNRLRKQRLDWEGQYRPRIGFLYAKNLSVFTKDYYNVFDTDFSTTNTETSIVDVSFSLFLPNLQEQIDRTRSVSIEAAKAFNQSTLPIDRLKQVMQAFSLPDSFYAYLFSIFYGVEVNDVVKGWLNIKKELEGVLTNLNQPIPPDVENTILTLVRPINFSSLVEPGSTIKGLTVREAKIRLDFFINESRKILLVNNRNVVRSVELLIDSALFKAELERFIYFLDNLTRSILSISNKVNVVASQARDLFKSIDSIFIIASLENVETYERLIRSVSLILNDANYNSFTTASIVNKLGLSITDNSGVEYLPIFKAFIYYFCSFLLEDEQAKTTLPKLINDYDKTTLPPNMKVFRVHHFADDTHNILANNIVASTAEMWNTVVIEHPSPGTANNNVESGEVYDTGTLSAGITWQYWPKQEITGVIGLQFHPGLTLANKKIKVFTEINCQSPDLAAKIACSHLADGIKKMYRGNLALLGKHIKPHDRIVLADNFTKMQGPVEVESVVHHWNATKGWVTNILPNAVCESNPGSSVLQTAVLEATYQTVFNAIDIVSDILTYATIIVTLGAATPLAAARFSISKGIKRMLLNPKAAFNPKRILGSNWARLSSGVGKVGHDLTKSSLLGMPWSTVKSLYKNFGGPVQSLLLNEIVSGTATYGTSLMFKHSAIPAYVEIGSRAEQLPVIFTPLIYNGNPFSAGLETEDNIWAIGSFGFYYSMKELQAGASRFLEDFFNEEI